MPKRARSMVGNFSGADADHVALTRCQRNEAFIGRSRSVDTAILHHWCVLFFAIFSCSCSSAQRRQGSVERQNDADDAAAASLNEVTAAAAAVLASN